MIEKLISAQNIGKFSKLVVKGSDWNGVFGKANIIFAPNGSGKTTLSLILQSLKGGKDSLPKKITFKDLRTDSPEQIVRLRVDKKTVEYKNGTWTHTDPLIEVFSVHFIEDTLFTGSSQPRQNQQNLFAYLSGDEGIKYRDRLADLRTQDRRVARQLRSVEASAKKGKTGDAERQGKLAALTAERDPIQAEIAQVNKDLGLYSQALFDKFTVAVNKYLGKFSRTMRLEKISKKMDQRTTLYLTFGQERVVFDATPNQHQVKYTLSEGDKNALAISVFLAKISFAADPSRLVVVFDDPLTSLDSGRRYLTVKELARLSEQVAQTFVLTHDASFAADLQREIRKQEISLELVTTNGESWLRTRDHEGEHITGLFRDIRTLTDYQKKGAADQSDRRDVLRCLRPTLEGFVRVRYFDRLEKTQWLGDFIEAVRNAQEGDDLHRIHGTSTFDDLCEVNDYSKRLHHSSPSEPDSLIEEDELQLMVAKTLRLIKTL